MKIIATTLALVMMGVTGVFAADSSEALPTGSRAAFLNGLLELSPAMGALIVNNQVVVGKPASSADPNGHFLVMSIIDKGTGVQGAALTSIRLELVGHVSTMVALPAEALVIVTDRGIPCPPDTLRRYDFENDGRTDTIWACPIDDE